MCVPVHVCEDACMVYTYVEACKCMHVCYFAHVWEHGYVCVSVLMRLYVRLQACVYDACVHICVHKN